MAVQRSTCSSIGAFAAASSTDCSDKDIALIGNTITEGKPRLHPRDMRQPSEVVDQRHLAQRVGTSVGQHGVCFSLDIVGQPRRQL